MHLRTVYFFPIFMLAFFACSDDRPGILSPGDKSGGNSGFPSVEASLGTVELDIKLRVREGLAPEMPAMLASAKDDTVSDSTHLYIDVEIENVGPDLVLLPDEAEELVLQANVSFVDFPYKKNFHHGDVKLVVGWTETGLQASEVLRADFADESTLLFEIPLSRVDSFHVADNVAVYGEVLAEGRFIYANRILQVGSSLPADEPEPDLLGYLQRVDTDNGRIYVSGATVVLTDSTRVEDSQGRQIGIGHLTEGHSELTITALAWAYTIEVGMTANGWEFRHFNIYVARRTQ